MCTDQALYCRQIQFISTKEAGFWFEQIRLVLFTLYEKKLPMGKKIGIQLQRELAPVKKIMMWQFSCQAYLLLSTNIEPKVFGKFPIWLRYATNVVAVTNVGFLYSVYYSYSWCVVLCCLKHNIYRKTTIIMNRYAFDKCIQDVIIIACWNTPNMDFSVVNNCRVTWWTTG